jgi:hypothetical protein
MVSQGWAALQDLGKPFQNIGKRLRDIVQSFPKVEKDCRNIWKSFSNLGKRLLEAKSGCRDLETGGLSKI